MMHPMKNLLLHLNLKPHHQQRKASKVTLNVHRIHDHLILLSNPKNPNHQNKKLLGSSNNKLIKARGFRMLKEMLLEGKNHGVKLQYVSNVENLKLQMNGLRETSKWVQLEAFHVFKLFVDNPDMIKEVTDMLWLNKTKLLQFMDGLKPSRHDDQDFEADKARVIREISMLQQVNCKPMCLAGQLHRFSIISSKS